MWSRKRIDISWGDFAAGLAGVLFRRDRARAEQRIANAWVGSERAVFSCLSVRSGWDLLLDALNLPQGSEVLMSAMTIPDMAAIVEAHGLVPVPLELDAATAAPSPETLRTAITPNSKVVLIAHLFGTRIDLTPHIEIARKHQMLFIEDCAQAYAGPNYPGHTAADVSMFSFGTIKTNTALGGGVLHLRDWALCEELKDRQARYPVQSRGKYFQRLLKYGGLKLLSTYPAFALFTRLCKLMGIDQNSLLNSSVRGFAGNGVERFRLKPSVPLLALMARRIQRPNPLRLERQRRLGDRLRQKIQPIADCPGRAVAYNHYWVFPLLTDSPQELIKRLHREGFDATQGESMRIIKRPEDSPAVEPVVAQDLLDRMVYVPMYPELTEKAVDRLAEVLLRFFAERRLPGPAEPVFPEAALQEANEV